MNRMSVVAKGLAEKLARNKPPPVTITGLCDEDREMFDRIITAIVEERNQSLNVTYREHFALQPNWKPNQRFSGQVLHAKQSRDAKRKTVRKLNISRTSGPSQV